MTNSKEEKIIRITDLLEQITAVDQMIDLHSQKGDKDDLMLNQYQYRREQFLKEFRQILTELNITPKDLAA